MEKNKNITMDRQSGENKVRRVQVRSKKVAITLYLDKATGLRLAKEIKKRWGEK